MAVDYAKVKKAAKLFNESEATKAEDKLKVVGVKNEDLVFAFAKAVDAIPVDDEDKYDEEVFDVFNEIPDKYIEQEPVVDATESEDVVEPEGTEEGEPEETEPDEAPAEEAKEEKTSKRTRKDKGDGEKEKPKPKTPTPTSAFGHRTGTMAGTIDNKVSEGITLKDLRDLLAKEFNRTPEKAQSKIHAHLNHLVKHVGVTVDKEKEEGGKAEDTFYKAYKK